jgi:hypothetical protein
MAMAMDGDATAMATDGGNTGTSILLANLTPTLFILAVLLSIIHTGFKYKC